MIRLRPLQLALAFLTGAAALPAQQLTLRTGTFPIGDVAQVKVPADCRFLDANDTKTLIEKVWHNPPGMTYLGALVPAGFEPNAAASWAVIMSYKADGFVKDAEAASINYDQLLQQIRSAMTQVNEQRKKEGYPSIEMVGWAEPPRYDSVTHKLYWARELKFGESTQHTLNYNIRILGRHGILVLNAVAAMSQLAEVRRATPEILQAVNFQPGNRYTDFNSHTDKIAEYGIAALIVGGIAAKAGFFKLLLVGILAAKKFIILAFVAVGGFFKKLFKKKKPAETTFGSTTPSV